MKESRSNFDEALEGFKDFLYSQQWSPKLLWLTQERYIGHKRKYWIYRPSELTSEKSARAFYNLILETEGSIRMDGFCKLDSYSLVYVENYGGDSRLLNYGVSLADNSVKIVKSKLWWNMLKFMHRNHTCFMSGMNIIK